MPHLMPRSVDKVVRDANLLPNEELHLLVAQHNVNLHASDDESDEFLDEDDLYDGSMVHVIDEQEFFERYFD